ncbi:PucR family transcriptional regulator [Streptomyces apricus]|uniref:PucR family transcriptional regulator n=1 Tax=Streptomyces apricus TaxID=1828112 RepID=A0A5A9ZGS6_9ACTN|nr:helix-turn-helix domain-containing protein [Streptomyces apricus]KAA0916175.1 PucR family transcriptional regulator [Streptomyces apricus]
MGSLFAELTRQASANARREVETYAREIPELQALDSDSRARTEALEYAVWFRRRTVELAPRNGVLTDDDLGYIASMGEVRAGAGMSLDSRQRVLRLHTELMLREINEATEAQRGGDVEELMRIMSWFAPQGERGIGAYRGGFVTALRRRLPYVEQVGLLARSLMSEDPMAAELAQVTGMELAGHYTVAVIRVPDCPLGDRELGNGVEALVKAHRVPVVWCPGAGGVSRGAGGELVALVPGDADTGAAAGATAEALAGGDGTAGPSPAAAVTALVADFAPVLGRLCAVGTAGAPRSALAGALDRARRISAAAPLRRTTARPRPHTTADVFVELAVADVPFVDDWLRTVARLLRSGPDLLPTLDAYYRHDMNRGLAARALNVHPRTLDYRLRRVRELTDIDPGSTRGVRILSAVVTRSLSGAWRNPFRTRA